jgi:putative transposase
MRQKLHAYLSSVARNSGCECYLVGGDANHVHLAIRLARTMTIAHLITAAPAQELERIQSQ